MTAATKKAQAEMTFKLIPAEDVKPPQRFGKDMIEGSLMWKQFTAAIKDIGPHQVAEFRGPKTKVQSWKRKVNKYITEEKLPLYCYIISNEDEETQTLYVVGK